MHFLQVRDSCRAMDAQCNKYGILTQQGLLFSKTSTYKFFVPANNSLDTELNKLCHDISIQNYSDFSIPQIPMGY